MKAERELMEVNKFSRLESTGGVQKQTGVGNLQNNLRTAKDMRLAKQETISRDTQVQSDLEKTAIHKKGFRINSKPSQSNVSVGTTTTQTNDATNVYERQLSSTSKISQVSTPSQTDHFPRQGPILQKPVSRGALTRTKLPAIAPTDILASTSIQTDRILANGSASHSTSVQTGAFRHAHQTGQQRHGHNDSTTSLNSRQSEPDGRSLTSSAVSRGNASVTGPMGRLSDVLGLQGGKGFQEPAIRDVGLSAEQSDFGENSTDGVSVGTGIGAGGQGTKPRMLPARAGLPRVGPIAQMKKVKEQFRQGLITGLERDKGSKTVQNQEEGLLASILSARIKQDKDELQVFLEKLGLMKFYDRLWDIGVDSLEGLAHVKVEEWNMMYVPAGTQMKIERELKKMGISAAGQAHDMAIGTDDLEAAESKPAIPERGLFAKYGIKMKKAEHSQTQSSPLGTETVNDMKISHSAAIKSPKQPTMMSFGGTQTEETDSMPLNVEMDQGPIVRVVEIRSKAPLKSILKGPSLADSSPRTNRNTANPSISAKKKAKFTLDGSTGTAFETTQYGTQASTGFFSFANLGSNQWSIGSAIVDHDERSTSSTPKADKPNLNSQGKPAKTSAGASTQEAVALKLNYVQKYQSRKVSCYSCYKTFDELEAMTHRSLPGRFFCGRDCLNDETQKLLTTCSICFKVLNKAESVPCKNQWTCSDKCFTKAAEQQTQPQAPPRSSSNNFTSKAAQELAYQASLRGSSQPTNPRDRSVGSSADPGDVDLDFDY